MSAARWISSICLWIALIALSATPAGAADSVYWSSYEGDTISHAAIGGGGGGDVPIAGTTVEGPFGVAIDPAEGKLYWTNWDGDSIGVSNLDGSGAGLLNTEGTTLDGPSGLVIDPATRRIYWGNSEINTISYANLNGSGGGNLNTTGATVLRPYGIGFDPKTQRIFWPNYDDNSISYANVDGSGGSDLDTTGAELDQPVGISIYAPNNLVFWGNAHANSIASASLEGGDGRALDPQGAVVEQPEGLAIDAAANRVYWANVKTGTIAFAGLDGGTSGALNTAGANTEYVSFPVVLKTPVNTVLPSTVAPKPILVATVKKKGAPPFVESQTQTFSCSQGSWAGDLDEAYIYRAPRSFAYRWLRNERPIPGATSSTYAATEVGDYACRVTATNGAGPTAETTSPTNIQASFRADRPLIDAKRGVAKLPVATSGSGVLALRGKGLKSQALKSKAGNPTALSGYLLVRAKGKALKRLKAKGKVKAAASLEFTPTNGSTLRATKSIALRLRH